jgi:hypothetical protein
MPEPTHACPGGCGAQVPYGQLSCKPDWFRLPKPIRDEINTAYRHRRTDPGRHLRAIRDAGRWYRANPRESG